MNNLVEAARSYIGVRYRHRGRSRVGIDCAGLMVLAYRDCGVQTSNFVLYGREPIKDGLVEHTTLSLGQPLPLHTPLQEGDIVILRFDKEPHHMGMIALGNYGGLTAHNIIHADGHVGRVVEVRLDTATAKRITHIFRRAV